MKRLLFACLLLLALGIPCRADRDIVFSAAYYKMSGHFYHEEGVPDEETVTQLGPHHLYRINPNGTRRTRITSGPYDDINPVWSPDGRSILFLRSSDKDVTHERETLCIMAAGGGSVRSLAALPPAMDALATYYWSPDSRSIAVFTQTGVLILIDARTHRRRTVSNVGDGCWSPDGHCLYLGFSEDRGRLLIDHDRIMDVRTGKLTPVASPVWGECWLDDNSVIGVMPVGAGSGAWPQGLRIVDNNGRSRKEIAIHPMMGEWGDQPEPARWYYRFLKLQSSGSIFLTTHHHVTDGDHPWCSLIDLKSGKWRLLYEGQFCGLSPDTRRFAVANHDWVGPYKHGGERLGPLEVASTRTGKGRAITGRLVDINGGDWR